jgi:histidinol-phosphate phosphatase family protein
MLVTSACIPVAAVGHRLVGEWRHRHVRPTDEDATGPRAVLRAAEPCAAVPCAAVLFDRDGTLVHDVAYNGDPDLVALTPTARAAVDRVRAAGVAIGVVTNQSGVGRGVLRRSDVAAVNARIDELLGGLDGWFVCEHGPDVGCACRKPAPGLVLDAAAAFGVEPSACVVIGDIGTDVQAARAVGARGIIVPTAVTLADELALADEVATDLLDAVDRALATRVATP